MKQNENDDLFIKFYVSDLEILSDGSLRKLLSEFSRLSRDILSQELDYVMTELELPYRQEQSLRDIIKNSSGNHANFYVEKLEKGSLTLVAVLGGFTLFVLQKTLGKNLENAWAKSDLGKDAENLMLRTFNKLSNYIKKRKKHISREILPQYKGKILGGRYMIKKVVKEKIDGKETMTIKMEPIKSEIVNEDFIIDNNFLLDMNKKELKKLRDKKGKKGK